MNAIALKHKVQKGEFVLDVDTTIPASGITGVLGESGSGKTTLLRCIAGLERSEPVDAQAVHQRRVGYVFQDPQLFAHLSVRKNIEYGMKRSKGKTIAIDEVADLLDIGSILERTISGLSGGEAQRVSIARVLCQSPKLILMDEPLSALDVGRRNEVMPYLDRLHTRSSVPIIYVSHSIDEICRLSDHLLILDDGRIVASGGAQETLTRTDLRVLGGENAGAVIEASPLSYDDQFDLTLFKFAGGELWAPGRYAAESVRLRVRASDVSLSREAAVSSTILNIIAAEITGIRAENAATNLLTVKIGQTKLIARITCKSTQQLELGVGDHVFAQIKSVTVRR